MGRAYRKEIALTIGPINTLVNLYTVVPGKGKSQTVKWICADHKTPVKQQYICPEDEKVFEWGTWSQAVKTPDGWKLVDPEARPTLEEASKVLELQPVATSDIGDNSFEGESVYWLEPSNEASMQTWSILVKQLKTRNIVFLTRGGFSKGGKEKLWKVELFRNFPVLRELRFPETITDPPEAEPVRVDKETTDLVKQFIDSRMATWEDIDTTDNLQAQFEKWVASGKEVKVAELDDDSKPRQSPEDLIAQLQEAVKAAKK